jgi:predicted PurR-regulated permease PerM
MTPVQQWLLLRLRRPGPTALLCVVLALFLVALPIGLVLQRLVVDLATLTGAMREMAETGSWRQMIAGQDWLVNLIAIAERKLDFARISRDISEWLGDWIPAAVQGSTQQVFALVVALYFTFYMLRDRRSALTAVTALSPLPADRMAELYRQLAETIRATVFGTLLVALTQGTLAGFAFWVAGVPSPVLWGTVTAVAATIPMLGTVVVWGPAVLFLFFTGHPGAAAGLLAWSLLIVSMVDNVLFPLLVGGRLQMHTIPTFVSLVGGVLTFGPAGLILGPVILSTTVFLIGFWRDDPQPAVEKIAGPDAEGAEPKG